ncbi:MAG: hypothetical protein RJA22_1045 [Verrucomicrobiota bacterium]|jgi:1,4-alpha-glucan branching enzyme
MSRGALSLVLHAHLPFVRHPEHDRFLEENWLHEAVLETYLPLVQVMEGWARDGMRTRLTLTLSPTLCSMLQDPLLQERTLRHLDGLQELAERERHRTHWDRAYQPLAEMYHTRFATLRETYLRHGRNLVQAFRGFQEAGSLEILTTAATHAVLPLLADHPPSLRAQVRVACDHYRACFGRAPRGIWLPECAYAEGLDVVLREAGLRWFLLDTHGLLYARPRPRYSVFAPILTPAGVAAFGRDLESARQVWSKHEGYPGDPRYRDFYRDIGFDLDLDYVRSVLPVPDVRTFTGIKYHAISGGVDQQVYHRAAALEAAAGHAQHFLDARVRQVEHLAGILDRPPHIVCPYDAELFGHWWYEGPEFLDYLVRKAVYDQRVLELTTPEEFLAQATSLQVAQPASSSWGEEGYLKVWLNESNEWIYPHLRVAQERMTALADAHPAATGLELRALRQAGRELLLAQASDWPFILRSGTSPEYARRRVKDHLLRFIALHEQLTVTRVDEPWLANIEAMDNLFPDLDYRHWASAPSGA